jgi:hypothetical protein
MRAIDEPGPRALVVDVTLELSDEHVERKAARDPVDEPRLRLGGRHATA